jgi:EAL domain-containing protein (putative c-di-GMP-specific phosphodiesterase class I)
VVELSSTRTIAFEALVRWEKPPRGLLQPDAFLPQAEKTGFIVEIDRWMWERAIFQLIEWQSRYPRDPNIRMAVNLSASDLSDGGLLNRISDLIHRSGVDAGDLVFEVTESVLLDDTAPTTEFLMQLKGLGVLLALDDFGTAFSSLSYIRRFPFDHLKLDISFTSELPHSTRSMLLVDEICHLARSMGMTVIAEGIETQEQADALSSIGCDYGQGYLYARPLSAADSEKRLSAGR